MEPIKEHFPVKDQLHTDVLWKQYWKITADVLRHDNVENTKDWWDRIRVCRLVDDADILRTYALTFLTYDKNNLAMVIVDNEIREGWLIGETFRKYWYIVKKNVIDVFIMDIPDSMQADFQCKGSKAKARLTEFYAKKWTIAPTIYGTVLEIYSPDFRSPDEGLNKFDLQQINPCTWSLQDCGVPIDEIWSNLDKASWENTRENHKVAYDNALKMSKYVLDSFHQKIKNYLM